MVELKQYQGAIMALVMVALIAATGALTLDAFKTDIGEDVVGTQTTNETVVWTNATVTTLANSGVAYDITCINVWNNVTGYTSLGTTDANGSVSSTYWTCTESGITLTDTSDEEFNVTRDVQVTYTYKVGNHQRNVTVEGELGIANASDFLSTIGTLLGVAALVLVIATAFYAIRR